ncbi:MAG: D-2-hydroxyacid dehydrogenase [Planctomycetota bacterium]|jgi:phosphoglycerate dehydrogenase-like enzyme
MKVVIGTRLSDQEAETLRSAVPQADIRLARDRQAVLAEITDAEVYVPGPLAEEVFQAAGQLRWVHFPWAGLDGCLPPALIKGEATVTNSAGLFAIPMAEHALALMLAFARGLNRCVQRGPQDLWHGEGARKAIESGLRELHGATLGIVGYGGIGRATAERARAFGMRVLALRRRPRPDQLANEVWGPGRLEDLLRRSDYLLLSCALTPETEGMIGREELALVKPGAVLVNVARGTVVDEAAMVEALREGKLGGAGLDVTAEEPLPADSPLWEMENVIITPHVAGASPATWGRLLELMEENLRRYAAGEPLLHVVDRELGY